MTDSDPDVSAAIELWPSLASVAWARYLTQGPGVLLVGSDELRAARRAGGPLEPGFVSLEMIPRGDDFRPLIAQYDPTRQVMLLVRDADGAERMLTLEADGRSRPLPEACYQAANSSPT